MIFLSLAIALTLDWLFGWSDRMIDRVGHPVIWAGHMISALETRLNFGSDARKLGLGALLALMMIAVAIILGALLQDIIKLLPASFALTGILAWPLLASRAMYDHIEAILKPLEQNDLEGARTNIAKIVGRDPKELDENGIRRAAIESLAENTSDGIIAPLFWGLIFGLPGILAYKMINTLDSMIGYRNARYLHFGRASARIDDIANFVPARLTALLFAITAGHLTVLRGIWKDASKHRSPNAGWPETAMARLIGARLSGPRLYDTGMTNDAWLNGNAPDPSNQNLALALGYFSRLIKIIIGLLFAASLVYLVIYEF